MSVANSYVAFQLLLAGYLECQYSEVTGLQAMKVNKNHLQIPDVSGLFILSQPTLSS